MNVQDDDLIFICDELEEISKLALTQREELSDLSSEIQKLSNSNAEQKDDFTIISNNLQDLSDLTNMQSDKILNLRNELENVDKKRQSNIDRDKLELMINDLDMIKQLSILIFNKYCDITRLSSLDKLTFENDDKLKFDDDKSKD